MTEYTVKRGVLLYLSDEIEKMLHEASITFNAFKLPVVITSGIDGPHREGSLHFQFRAVDIRKIFKESEYALSWDIHGKTILEVLEGRFAFMGYPAIVIDETDHIHLEWIDGTNP